ncbi:MAG: hypothetical protein ABSG21_04150 [Spirochaetia bacterium]|jgi:hypothetical protein
MHPLARRIALLFSGFSLVLGVFLLAYNLALISAAAVDTALNLWPLLLVLAGFMLVGDSAKKRVSAHVSRTTTHEYLLPIETRSTELALRVQFSYGKLLAEPAASFPRLVTESFDTRPAPAIRHEIVGDCSEVSIAVSQPLFPTHMKTGNTWRLQLPIAVPLRLSLQLHEADMHLDLRRLVVETIDLRTDSGTQEILLGLPRKKLNGQIYCSGSNLSLVLPPRVFALVRLLNPFCRVDFPQGDLEKREDGSLITPRAADSRGRVEIDVDGPIRNLVLDIGETEDAPDNSET